VARSASSVTAPPATPTATPTSLIEIEISAESEVWAAFTASASFTILPDGQEELGIPWGLLPDATKIPGVDSGVSAAECAAGINCNSNTGSGAAPPNQSPSSSSQSTGKSAAISINGNQIIRLPVLVSLIVLFVGIALGGVALI